MFLNIVEPPGIQCRLCKQWSRGSWTLGKSFRDVLRSCIVRSPYACCKLYLHAQPYIHSLAPPNLHPLNSAMVSKQQNELENKKKTAIVSANYLLLR